MKLKRKYNTDFLLFCHVFRVLCTKKIYELVETSISGVLIRIIQVFIFLVFLVQIRPFSLDEQAT